MSSSSERKSRNRPTSANEKRKNSQWMHHRRKSTAGDLIDIMQMQKLMSSPSESLSSTISLKHAESASDVSLPSVNRNNYAAKLQQKRENLVNLHKSPSDGDLRVSSAASSVSLLDANHRLLTRYQAAMTSHLEKLNRQLLDETRTMEERLKVKRETHKSRSADFQQSQNKKRKAREMLNEMSDKTTELSDKMKNTEKELEENKRDLTRSERSIGWVEMQEKYWQHELDKTNQKIGKVRNQDIEKQISLKTVKNVAQKAQKQLVELEKEKKEQDHKISTLKEGIAETETELSQITESLKEVYHDEYRHVYDSTGDSDTDRLKTKENALNLKKTRFEEESSVKEKEISSLKSQIRSFQDNISKLNAALQKKTEAAQTLEQHQATVRDRTLERTKEAERNCEQMESRVSSLQNEIQQFIVKLQSKRSEMSALEQKVSAAEEAQALVEDDENKVEVAQLLSDIRRKKQKYTELTNKQMETLAREVENEVYKRDKLLDKDKAQVLGQINRPTKLQLSQQLIDLRKQLHQWKLDLEESKREFGDIQFAHDEKMTEVEEKQNKLAKYQSGSDDHETEQNDLLELHYINEQRLHAKQLLQKTLGNSQMALKKQVTRFAQDHSHLIKSAKEKRKEILSEAIELKMNKPQANTVAKRVELLLGK